MSLFTEKQQENNDVLLDIDEELAQDEAFKDKLEKLVAQQNDDQKADDTLSEMDIQNKLEPLEKENETLKTKLETFMREKEALTVKLEQLEEENEKLKQRSDELEEERKPIKTYDAKILESLIYPINTIDQIAAAYRNTGENELVVEQLEKVAELTIKQIESVGIEEIQVYGKEIDGTYMESFGSAQHVKDETLPPHTVAIVSRRAFKRKDSDEIIQHALVYTVPEEKR